MEDRDIVVVLAALAQPSRLAVFRLLTAAYPDPVAAGAVMRQLALPASTLSAHLSILCQAGLVSVRRDGRLMLYRTEIDRLNAVMTGLVNTCCGGRPEICGPLAEAFTLSPRPSAPCHSGSCHD